MSRTRQIVPVAGLLATIGIAGYMVVRLDGQAAVTTGDFSSAVSAEVRDAQGQPLLRGLFVLAEEDDDDIERKATLEPAGADADAAGDAEVEFSRGTPADQEIEFSVRNVEPGAALTFVIDGTQVAAATADQRGRAEVELDVATAGAAPSP
jgi:hypothetical protein